MGCGSPGAVGPWRGQAGDGAIHAASRTRPQTRARRCWRPGCACSAAHASLSCCSVAHAGGLQAHSWSSAPPAHQHRPLIWPAHLAAHGCQGAPIPWHTRPCKGATTQSVRAPPPATPPAPPTLRTQTVPCLPSVLVRTRWPLLRTTASGAIKCAIQASTGQRAWGDSMVKRPRRPGSNVACAWGKAVALRVPDAAAFLACV